MARIWAQKCTALALSTLLASSAFAQSAKGIVYPADGVSLNGISLPTTAAVNSGDRIQTQKAAALVVEKGTTVQVAPHTTLTMGPVVQLGCGAATVSTSDGVGVRTDSLAVAPAARTASKFSVANAGGTIEVRAESGSVLVSEAGQTTTVAAGQTITRPATSNCPLPPAGGNNAPAMAGKSGSGKVIGILAGVAGGGAAAAVLATRDSSKGPVSPSRP